jgi:hypothetical protein
MTHCGRARFHRALNPCSTSISPSPRNFGSGLRGASPYHPMFFAAFAPSRATFGNLQASTSKLQRKPMFNQQNVPCSAVELESAEFHTLLAGHARLAEDSGPYLVESMEENKAEDKYGTLGARPSKGRGLELGRSGCWWLEFEASSLSRLCVEVRPKWDSRSSSLQGMGWRSPLRQ